jgi:hypothetical protein
MTDNNEETKKAGKIARVGELKDYLKKDGPYVPKNTQEMIDEIRKQGDESHKKKQDQVTQRRDEEARMASEPNRDYFSR